MTLMRAVDIARMDWQDWHPQFVALYCADRFAVPRILCLVRLYRRWRRLRWLVLNALKQWRCRMRI